MWTVHRQLSEYLTPQEVAKILKVSEKSVISKFQKRSGVIDLGGPETRFKRRYRVLRIPRVVLEAYLLEIGVR